MMQRRFAGVLSTQDYLQRMSRALEEAGLCFGHGTDNAWDEACWLLETLLRRRGVTSFSPETLLESDELVEVEALLEQRITTHKPMAYLLKEAWFCHIPFYVDERVLVPRSPIGELILNQFDPLLDSPPARILDLCTGGGCIGLACALAFPEAQVVLTDVSPDALDVARINVERLQLQERVQCVQSDLFDKVQGTFDLIVTNPPYVGAQEYSALPDEYQAEPRLGLLTGQDGLEIPLKILQDAGRYLNQTGLLVLEVGNTWQALDAARPELPLLWLDFEHGGTGVCVLRARDLQSTS